MLGIIMNLISTYLHSCPVHYIFLNCVTGKIEQQNGVLFQHHLSHDRSHNLIITNTLEPGISLAVRCRLSSPQAPYQEFSTTNCRSRVDSSWARRFTCACMFGRGHSCGLSIRSMANEWSIGRSLKNKKVEFEKGFLVGSKAYRT